MNNGQVGATINLGGNPDWSPVATGDFNRDGFGDIIWRNKFLGPVSALADEQWADGSDHRSRRQYRLVPRS